MFRDWNLILEIMKDIQNLEYLYLLVDKFYKNYFLTPQ